MYKRVLKGTLGVGQVVLAVLPGQPKAVCLDGGGQQALSVLRQMGMPALVGVVTTAARSGSGDTAGAAAPAQKLKERAAARKRAAAVLQSEVCCPGHLRPGNIMRNARACA